MSPVAGGQRKEAGRSPVYLSVVSFDFCRLLNGLSSFMMDSALVVGGGDHEATGDPRFVQFWCVELCIPGPAVTDLDRN